METAATVVHSGIQRFQAACRRRRPRDAVRQRIHFGVESVRACSLLR